MRTTAILTTALLSASLVAGCGSGDNGKDDGKDKASAQKSSSTSAGGDYCEKLKAAKADFATFESDNPDFSKFDDAIGTFHDLADSAPSEVADDWKAVDGALSSMEKALSDAGLSMADIGAISAGKLPAGMTPAELQAIGPKLQSAFSGLETDTVEKAGDAIEKHAKSECGIELSD